MYLQLRALFLQKGGGPVDNHKNIPNRLINEKSPHLLQHAYNPVQWYPWDGEAFEKARLEDKPVFYLLGTADVSDEVLVTGVT